MYKRVLDLAPLVTRNLGDVASTRAAIFGYRDPTLNTGKRSGWKILRNYVPVGEAAASWYIPSLWEENVPQYQQDRYFIRKEELAYRRLKGKSVPPKKGQGKRKTKKK